MTELHEQSMTIGGNPIVAQGTFDVINPSTGTVLGRAPDCTAEQLENAVAAAQSAFVDTGWRHDEAARRASLSRAADTLAARMAELAPILTAEQGKPIVDANTEIFAAIAWLRYFADLDVPAEVSQDAMGGRARGLLPAAGGRRGHHTVELPPGPGDVEDRARTARRQHHRAQTLAVHAPEHVGTGGAAAAGAAARGVQRDLRARSPRRGA